MVLRMFYDKLCTIDRPSFTKVDGTSVKSFINIYAMIPCAYWNTKQGNFKQGEAALESDTVLYHLNINGDTPNVKRRDKLTLYEKDGSLVGIFLVEDVIPYPNIKGYLDNTALEIKLRDG